MDIDDASKRILLWFKGKKLPPQMVQIYPTNACNLKCIFCVQTLGIYDLNDVVPKKRWFQIVNEICEMGTREILISGGGEPLLTPQITLGIMRISKRYNLKGRIITNGTLWSKKLIKETIRLSWDHVIFSLDAPDSKTHDYLRGANGTFEKVIKNIKLFNEIKSKLNLEFPTLEITCVLNIYNFKKIPKLIRLAHLLKIKSVNVEPICVNNPTAEKIKLNKYQREIFLRSILPKAEKLAKKYKIFTNFEKLKEIKIIESAGKLRNKILNFHVNNPLTLPCYEPWLWPKIEANGEVWPCSSVSLKENIKEKSFKKIWFGEKFNKFRRNIMEMRLPKECDNCVLTHVEINRLIRKKLMSFQGEKNESS